MKFHTSLPVRDLDQTVGFYQALFDEPPAKLRADYAKFVPRALPLNISFHVVDESTPLMTDLHLGFELPTPSALDATHARLAKAGLVSEERKTSVCCYANQDKFWITDPNGYRWELYYLVNDSDHKRDEATGCCGSAETTETRCC